MTQEELRKIFNQKKQKTDKKTLKATAGFVDTSFEQFQNWFSIDNFNLGCHYCGTTNQKSFELYLLRPHATRGGKRGKRLELDRKDPCRSYDDLDNIVWCCYWCNNAKSNFFTYEEFKPIARSIGDVLKNFK